MQRSSNLYTIMTVLALAAYAWVGLHILYPALNAGQGLTACLFKAVSGWPCPSCGVTRSVLLLLGGAWQEALSLNPLGVPALGAMLVVPAWLTWDGLRGSRSFAHAYLWTEARIKTRKINWIPPAVGMLGLWGWNIAKHF